MKKNSELFYKFNNIAIHSKNKEYDTFCDSFGEFIYELDCVDLSDKTIENLYGIFIKDMLIYFKNKGFDKEEL